MINNNMNVDPMLLSNILGEKKTGEKYAKLGIKYNPFPRSGTTNINGNDIYNSFMTPIDPSVLSAYFGDTHPAISVISTQCFY